MLCGVITCLSGFLPTSRSVPMWVSRCGVKNMSPHNFFLLSLADLRLRVQFHFSRLWASVSILRLAQLTKAHLWPDLELQIRCLPPSYPLGLSFGKGKSDWLNLTNWVISLGPGIHVGSSQLWPGSVWGLIFQTWVHRNCGWCFSNFIKEALNEINTLKRV